MDPEMNGNVSVEPSAEFGNLPLETPEAPSPEPTPATPAEPKEAVAPAAPELIELPDGRKVDAQTVAQEYKNLLSDYTKKSQELASYKAPTPEPLPTKPTSPFADPTYVPQTYEEIIQAAEARALQAFEAKENAKVAERQALENSVSNQIAEIKGIDPTLNENALFVHATKYGFRDLKVAHQNMRDMSELAKKVQTTTAANIAKRTDPVSVSPGATGARPDPANFSSAMDYLRSLKG